MTTLLLKPLNPTFTLDLNVGFTMGEDLPPWADHRCLWDYEKMLKDGKIKNKQDLGSTSMLPAVWGGALSYKLM